MLGKSLALYGFVRTKSTWYVRLEGEAAEFIHVHKFTFGPYFRMHVGRRLLRDDSDHVALNGPDSDNVRDWRYVLVPKRKYDLCFAAESNSIELCVRQMTDFYKKVAQPWYQMRRKGAAMGPAKPSEATKKLLGLAKIQEP